MFSKLARRATNAVVLAALAATMLVSASASAAPLNSVPSGGQPENALAKPTLKLTADFHVTGVQFRTLPGTTKVEYLFRVTNLGPNPASVKIKSGHVQQDCYSCSPEYVERPDATVSLAVNNQKEIKILCESSYQCNFGYVLLYPNSIDANSDDNQATLVSHSSGY